MGARQRKRKRKKEKRKEQEKENKTDKEKDKLTYNQIVWHALSLLDALPLNLQTQTIKL